MFEFQSLLFQGDDLLQAIADDVREPDGSLTRMSRSRHAKGDSVTRVQEALLTWRPDCLPVHGADGQYGDETAAAVRRFKIGELGVPAAEVIDDVGPKSVQGLDAIRAAAEAPPAPTVFIRRSAWGLARTAVPPMAPFDPVTLAYAEAVQTMQSRPASDPTSWAFQAAIHAVYVVLPGGDRRHIGNVALFGIEAMRDPDQPHEGATGFRHSFDVTDLVNELGDPANLGTGEMTLEFTPLEPELPPDTDLEPAAPPETETGGRVGR